MVVYQNTLEGGTSGVAITTGNSGGASGDAFHAVIGGSAVTFDSTRAAHGGLSAKISPTSGNAANVKYGQATAGVAFNATQIAFRYYLYWTGLPSTTYTMFRADDSAGAIKLRLNVGTNGRPILGYAGVATAWTATNAIPINKWVRLEMREVVATSGGSVNFAFYDGDSTTPIDSVDLTGLNTGSTTINQVNFGKYGTDTTVSPFWVDDIVVNTSTTSYIGPVTPPPGVTSPVKRWNGTAYVSQSVFRWNGSLYVPVVAAT